MRAAELAADLEPVHLGQHEVQDDEVGRLGGDPLQRGAPVADHLGLMPVPGQVAGDDVGQRLVVVDDEDAGHERRV